MSVVATWESGKLYQPGTVVQAVQGAAISQTNPTNADFEAGDTGWAKDTGWTIDQVDAFQGSWSAAFVTQASGFLENNVRAPVNAGQTIRARGLVKSAASGSVAVGIRWFDITPTEIKTDLDLTPVSGASTGWRETNIIAQAPANAVTATIVFKAVGVGQVRVDNAVWEYVEESAQSDVIFKAIQTIAGFSGTVEPVWPTVIGNQVVDNEVTWEAFAANLIVWEAKAILESGAVEPTFPAGVDQTVADNLILWTAESQRVQDENCPNTKEVAILASKIFAADDDIIPFSATVNPLDWTTVDDAGFIPFGLNTYGSQPISALGIYRSNLVAFNSKAFQMWQVDEDPANFAILDAVPVGCPFFKSLSPVSNDLVFLTPEGIRSMGIAGASTNLQAGFFGKQIDPLILTAIKGGEIPNGLYFPGAGQYWLFFGEEAFVLTMNGGKKDMSWSRYVFPSAIDDWTVHSNDLHLRSGDKIWRVDDDTLVDDFGGADVVFIGQVWWPYLDFGALGVTKQLIGFDTVAEGPYTVSIGWDQTDDTKFTTPYAIVGDTLPGNVIPIPVSAPSFQLRLDFTGNNAWEWSASTLYLQDWRKTS